MARAIAKVYGENQDDERIEPLVLTEKSGYPVGRFNDNDSVIFYDIRGEREVELTRSLVDPDFKEFPVKRPLNLDFLTFIQYDKTLSVKVAFPPEPEISDTLCTILEKNGTRFARVVESEKGIHITYFLDGKTNKSYRNEERIIIPSIKKSPEKYPEMQLGSVTKTVLEKMDDDKCKVIIANFANVDVVGHFENKPAILKAVEAVDSAIGKIVKRALQKKIVTIFTADHGTVEKWLYPDGTVDTGHTSSKVPFILVDSYNGNIVLRPGSLIDIAPTILDILSIEKGSKMTGKSLIKGKYNHRENNKVCMVILDGFGIGKRDKGDLIYQAKTPNYDGIMKSYPNTKLDASGPSVGNPPGTVGNSEIGHLHIGAGRVIESDKMKIEKSLKNGAFYKNKQILEIMNRARNKGSLHILGIVSFYSSHGSVTYLKALLKMAKTSGLSKVYIHSILGRRGEKAQSGAKYISDIERFTEKNRIGTVVSVIGRHWALDREENWDRIQKTYDLLVYGKGKKVVI